MTEPQGVGHSPGMTCALHEEPAAVAARPGAPPVVAAMDLASLYEQWVDFVWRSLRRMGVPAPSLDDAVQDVFLTAHRRLGDFEGRSSIKTWLFGIAVRVASDHRRSARRRGGLEPLPLDLADARGDPHEELARSRAIQALDGALSRLDDVRRAVFVMMEIEEMTAPEVAEALGMKLNTVYSRLRLARRDVEAALAAGDGGER